MLMRIAGSEISAVGTSAIWYYDYIESSWPNATYRFHATRGAVTLEGTFTMGAGIGVIDRAWMDSNIAIAIAERNGGSNFRNLNPRCTIDASLVEPDLGNRTTYWQIGYHPDNKSTRVLLFTVDANTGVVSSGYVG